jgi:transcriptional regulator with XRE-family HTH domain
LCQLLDKSAIHLAIFLYGNERGGLCVDEVRRLRLEKGWSQNELAYHAKLAPSVISLIETGKREPNATTLRKIAGALEVRIPDLFEESGSGKAGRRSSVEPSFNDILAETEQPVVKESAATGHIQTTARAELVRVLEDIEEGRIEEAAAKLRQLLAA